MRNIIITGGGMQNKGAQAMTFIVVNDLIARFPNHDIYLFSAMDMTRKKEEQDKYRFGYLNWYPIKFARCQSNPLLRLICKLHNGSELAQAEQIYRNCDMMIDISGYALGSNWNKKICDDYLDHLEFAHAFGIPMYLMSQSFGPFEFGAEHPGIDERCRKLLPTCRAILAREQEGYDALTQHYGLTNVQLAPDLVLNNKGIDLNSIFREVPEFQLPEIAPNSIAVVPNGRNLDAGSTDQVMGLYATAISHALLQGKTVYLMHHASSDAEICRELKARFVENEQVILLEQEFSCLEFNELVKRFDYLVASRFHSVVHAFKNGIPCITLGWAKKYEVLLKQFGQGDYLFDVRNNLSAKALEDAMKQMDTNRNGESEKILSGLAQVQLENVFDVLKL